jgi:geranylgeranyl diphosphate synthase type I
VAQIGELAGLAKLPADLLERALPDGHDAILDVPATAVARADVPQFGVDPFARVRGAVDGTLSEFLAARAVELASIDGALAPLADALLGLVHGGGKRLRPAFVYWGHRAAGADHDPAAVTVGAAVELLHAFALVHDDVMDRSDLRRGRPSVHRVLAAEHQREELRGDGEWFGASAAILAGDLVFVWADALLETAAAGPDALARVRTAFTDLRVEVMAGQYLDLRTAADPHATTAGVRRVAQLKSGRYTVTRPLLLGCALAGAPTSVRRALRAYGDAIGLAFQMRDDVLGLFGDPDVTGKGNADDLRAGKRTLLVHRALALAPGASRAELASRLGDPDLDDDGARRCRDIVAASGALASIEALIRAEHARALTAIAGVPQPARSALESLATAALERRA